MILSHVFQDRHFSAGKIVSLVHTLMINSNPTSVVSRRNSAGEKEHLSQSYLVYMTLYPG